MPSFKGFQDAVRKEAKAANRAFGDEISKDRTAETAAARAGERAGGAYGDNMQKRIAAALGKLPDIKVDVDSRAADAQISVIRARLAALNDRKIKVGADTTAAMAMLGRLEKELSDIAGRNADIDVKVNALAAAAELRAIDGMLDRIDGRRVTPKIEPKGFAKFRQELNDGGQSLRAFSGLALGIALLGPLLVPALAAMAGGAVALGTAFLGAAAGIGVMVLAFSGVSDAVKAMDAVRKDSEQIAERQRAQAQAIANAHRSLADAQRGASRAARDAGEANEAALRRVADARQDLADTVRSTAENIADAIQRERDAHQDLADTVEDVALRQQRADRDVEDARRDLADTINDTADRIEDALDRQADAERRSTEAVEDATRAQEALTDARREAADDLEDIDDRVISGRLAEEGAILDLQDSLDALNKLKADPNATERQIAQAQNAYDREVQNLEQLKTRNERLREEQAELHAQGVEGSDKVTAATERLNDATQSVADTAKDALDAAEAVTTARTEGADAIALAERTLGDTIAEQTRTRREGIRAIEEAERTAAEATRGLAEARAQGARDVAEAQRDVRDAVEESVRTQRDGAESVADANRRVAEAQLAVAEAARKAGVEGSASVRNLEDAMSKLGPAGQAFARFVDSTLRPFFASLRNAAQEGMLPGVTTFFREMIGTYGPGFTRFVGTMAKVLGDLFVQAAKMFKSPIWRDFFAMMEQMAPQFLRLFGQIGGQVLTIFAQLATAFAPIAKEMLTALSGLLDGFSKWLASTEGQKAMTEFMGYLREVGPDVMRFLGTLVKAMLQLGEALAPYAGMLLKVFTGILDFISRMDPAVLGAIAVAIIGVVIAIQTILGVVGALSTVVAALDQAMKIGLFGTFGLILVGLILLGVALWTLWKESETFRNLMTGAWEVLKKAFGLLVDAMEWAWKNILKPTLEAIADVAVWLWDKVLRPTFGFLKDAWDVLLKALKWAWDNVLKPVFEAVADVFVWLWDRVLKPTFGLLKAGWDLLLAALKWAWDNVLKPVFDAIKTVFEFLWNWVIKPILAAWELQFAIAFAAIKWVWDNVLKPVFNAVGDVFKWVWENVLKPAMTKVGEYFSKLGKDIKWVWDNVLKPVFGFLGDIFKDKIKPAFDKGVEAIAGVWNRLVELVKKPIEFVVNTIINGGIIDNFNRLARHFGTSEIDRVPLPKGWNHSGIPSAGGRSGRAIPLATGGVVPGFSPTPTADNIPALLTAGEYVLPVNAVNNLKSMYGDQFLEWLRRGGSAYASGGLVEFGRLLQSRDFRVNEHPAFGGVRGKHAKNSLHYSGRAIDVNYGPGGENDIEKKAIDAIVGLAKDYGLRTIWRTAGHFNHAHFDDADGPSILGKVGNFLKDAAGNVIGKPIEWLKDTVRGLYGNLSETWFGRMLIGGANRMLDAAVEKVIDLGGLAGDLLTDDGDDDRPGYASGGPVLYDRGGQLPPGLTTVLNASGRPEQILTAAQWDSLLGRGGRGSGSGVFEGNLVLESGALVGHVRGILKERDRSELQASRGRKG